MRGVWLQRGSYHEEGSEAQSHVCKDGISSRKRKRMGRKCCLELYQQRQLQHKQWSCGATVQQQEQMLASP
jgi:hypothetical protein